MILLDTNVVAEVMRPAPSERVVKWLDETFAESAISTISIFELSFGVAQLAAGKRRDTLQLSVARLIRRFGDRVFAFDTPAAIEAARIGAEARSAGRGPHQNLKLADLQLAGIVSAYDLKFATRNVADFVDLGLELINPWDEA